MTLDIAVDGLPARQGGRGQQPLRDRTNENATGRKRRPVRGHSPKRDIEASATPIPQNSGPKPSTMDAPRSSLSSKAARSIALDAFERLVVVFLFGRFALKMLDAPAAGVDFVTILILLSEILPVIFILSRRRSEAVSQRFSDWLLGISGATLPLLVSPTAPASLVPHGICAVIMLAGLYLQISAKLSLGQSFGLVAANRGVKVIGPYRFVRHPMYAGYMIAHSGFLLAFPSLWNVSLYSAEFVIQVARLLREERFLTQDREYRTYAARVRYRLLPAIF